MRISITLSALFFALFFSCKNDDDATGGPVQQSNYTPLTIGSYWVYDWVREDTLGNQTMMSQVDTMTVVGDTVLNGVEYAVLEGTFLGGPQTKFQRDSIGYLVNSNGAILFDSNNSTNLIFSDTIFAGPSPHVFMEYRMEGVITSVDVPAGIFQCVNYQGTIIPADPNHPHGTRITNQYYAEDIGLVRSRMFFFNSPDYIVSRLVAYHIE